MDMETLWVLIQFAPAFAILVFTITVIVMLTVAIAKGILYIVWVIASYPFRQSGQYIHFGRSKVRRSEP